MIVGSAQLDITPKPGIELSGFAARKQPSIGVLDPLAVRRSTSRTERSGCCGSMRTSWPLKTPSSPSCEPASQRELGIPRPRILISATHTHSGPPTVRLTGCGEYDARYIVRLKDQCLDVARMALANLEPCQLVAAEGRCELGVDRRKVPSAHTDPRWRPSAGEEPTGPSRPCC